MDIAAAIQLGVAIAASSVTAIAFGIAWWRASRRVRELEDRLMNVGPDRGSSALDQSVYDLAAQVDQLVSGQEFLTRVLTDRLGHLPLAQRDGPPPGTPD
jgi:hypothetical protein